MPIETGRLHVGTFIPSKFEPFHRLEDAARHLVAGTLDVGVLDAQDESALILSGEKPVEECSPGPAYVEIARRRRRKANADRVIAHLLNFRRAATASRTTSVLGSLVRART